MPAARVIDVLNRFKRQLRVALPVGVRRAGQNLGIGALALLISCSSLQNAVANGDTRTLSLKHLHTGETLTITYKRAGRYDEEALKKLNWELRDWRRNEAVRMDPKVLDAVWELYRDVGATEPIEIICGYRAPATNAMLRKRSSGVARFSQHTLGKAIDLHIPGVSLKRQREAAMRLQRGGVGYYPSSTFIHVDVARVRHWPRMTYAQLSKVFPNGRTVHIPSNGKPLKNYKLALADLAHGDRSPRSAGVEVASPAPRPTHLAKMSVQTDVEEDEDKSRTDTPTSAQAPTPAKVAVAVVTPPRADPRQSAKIAAKPAVKTAAKQPEPAEKLIQTASADGFVPRQETTPARAAAQTPWPMPEARNDRVPLDIALAYAADLRDPAMSATGALNSTASRDSTKKRRAAGIPRALIKKSSARLIDDPAGKDGPNAADESPLAITAGMRFDDPWLRAAMFAPSLYTSFTMSLSGPADYANVHRLIDKPTATVMMTFSDNPNPGLTCDRFSGGAVVFVSTVTFQHTAALQ